MGGSLGKITLLCVGGPCAGRRVTFDKYLQIVPVHFVTQRPASSLWSIDSIPVIAADVEFYAYYRKTLWCDGPHEFLVSKELDANGAVAELLRGYRP